MNVIALSIASLPLYAISVFSKTYITLLACLIQKQYNLLLSFHFYLI